MSAKVETRNGTVSGAEKAYETGTDRVKRGMAEMQKGGVIMDVVNAEQAKIAEEAGAVAVMALERVPADIRAAGGVARMADPRVIEEVMNAVSIPVMAKVRIGHFVEARVLEALGVDYIDESEVLTPADEEFHLDKKQFTVPFVCGARDLGEALRRIGEGASMIRTKGEPGTGNVVEAVRHMRMMMSQIRKVQSMSRDELMAEAKNWGRLTICCCRCMRPAGSRGQLCRRRNRHSGGCRAHDALGRRRRVCRLGDLQIREPGKIREGHRPSDDPLRRFRPDRQAVQGFGLGDAGNRYFHPRRSGTDAGAGLVMGGMTP